ncbi:MAG: hypothetical protein BJ554DRAFT_121 [Olpidium bornovanus]|uniref:Uncharacterized protein n=1 Tax=Olpidium bornovanus TaxID=278681 RepID=A0A8H8DIV6_9FUNG|nr:MAG: hypothetical protein BJ554DRAFT_121 [Olpidium bornovanus]
MAQLPRKSTPRPAGKRRQHGHQQRARQLPQLQKKKKKKKNNARPGAQSAAAEPVNQAAALSDKPPRNAVPALAGTRRDQGEAERRAVCPASDGASEKKEKADKRRKLSTKAGGRGQVFADSAESLLRFAATAARAEEKRLESKLERLVRALGLLFRGRWRRAENLAAAYSLPLLVSDAVWDRDCRAGET